MKPGFAHYPDLRWGLSTLGCPEYSLPQAIDLADEYGIEFLEIRTLNNSVDCHETLHRPENQPAMKRLAEAGRCRVLDSSFGLAAASPQAREALAKIAATADDFGIPYVRVFGGGNYGEPLDEARAAAARQNLEWYAGQGFRAQLALETHDICSSADFCLELQRQCGQAFPIVWDAHHTHHIADEAFQESFGKLKDSIVGVHFKDSHHVLDENGARQCSYDLIGQGTVPLRELFGLLEQARFAGPVTLEHEKFWRRQLPEIRPMLDSWMAFCGGW